MFLRHRLALKSVFLAVAALMAIVSGQYAIAAPPPQNGSDPIVVSNKWCEFDFDYDDDGVPNSSFDPESISYLPQETSILGKCNFTFTASAKNTVSFDSELDDWRAEVKLTEEPAGVVLGSATVHPGNRSVEGAISGVVGTVELRGRTPRGEKQEDLPQGYIHQLQIPQEFRLLEITIITSADDRERVVSYNVSAASNDYREAHQAITEVGRDIETAPPEEVLDLASQLLSEGYPRIAERVASLSPAPPEDNGGVNIWMLITIGLVVVIVIAIAVIVVVALKSNSNTSLPPPRR